MPSLIKMSPVASENFPPNILLNYVQQWQISWLAGREIRHISNKGTTQEPSMPIVITIGPVAVVSENIFFMKGLLTTTDDGRNMIAGQVS